MRSLALAGFAALVLSASSGCQQGELPDAPPPVGGGGGAAVEAPAVTPSEAQKNISGEGGPAAPEPG
jgi:hypothetical protein